MIKFIKNNKQNLRNLLLVILELKIILCAIILISYSIFKFHLQNYYVNFHYPLNDSLSFIFAFKTWDAQHYIFLAENWYSNIQAKSDAFYPLFPLIIKIINKLLYNNSVFNGLLLSNIFSFVSAIYLYLFVKNLFDEKIAFSAVVFLFVFPTGFFMSLIYTESLFIMLTVMFFYHLYKGEILLPLVCAFLLPLTRPTGILIIIPSMVFFRYTKSKVEKQYVVTYGFLLGLLTYFGIMKYYTDSFLTGFTAQELFVTKNSIKNLLNPIKWFSDNFISVQYSLHNFKTSVIDRIFFVLYLVFLFFIYKYLDKTLFSYSLVMGIVPALGDNLMSFPRYMLLIFPIFIILSMKTEKKYAWIVLMGILQILLLVRHSLFYWVA